MATWGAFACFDLLADLFVGKNDVDEITGLSQFIRSKTRQEILKCAHVVRH